MQSRYRIMKAIKAQCAYLGGQADNLLYMLQVMKNSPSKAVSMVYNPKTMSHKTIWQVLVQMFQ